MVSLKLPKNSKQEDDLLIIEEQDAMLILVNIANQLAINYFGQGNLEEEDEDLLPPFPGE